MPPGSEVFLSPDVTHRHHDYWPDPEAFDPDRFLPERCASPARFAWLPTLGGAHQCLGQEFAKTEATLVVAIVAQEFRLQLVPGARAEPRPMLTLRPRGGLPIMSHPA